MGGGSKDRLQKPDLVLHNICSYKDGLKITQYWLEKWEDQLGWCNA